MPTDARKIAAQLQQMKMGDIEFEMGVANWMGPYGREAIDASKAEYVGTKHSDPLSWQGLYTPPGSSRIGTEHSGFSGAEYVHEPFTEKSDIVNTLGIHADNETWGHEFRHRSGKLRDLGNRTAEKHSRMWDAYRASTPYEWDEAVSLWRDQRNRDYARGDISEYPEDIEADLRSMLKDNLPRFAAMEGLSALEQNLAKPKDSETHSLYYRSQAEKRGRQFGWYE